MGAVLDERASAFEATLQLPVNQRAPALAALISDSVEEGEFGLVGPAAVALLSQAEGPNPWLTDALRVRLSRELERVLSSGEGTARERLVIGETLGWLGDPRILSPQDPSYWVKVDTDDGPVHLGRFPVTNAEFQQFSDSGGYDDATHWSAEGLGWKARCSDPWPVTTRMARSPGSDARWLVVPNQPVVGVTRFEAEAYATSVGARLPRFDERQCAVRGADKRPYPWGSPFGAGNANTQEEALRRPCAVGLYVGDRTPEGVADLAGNVGEWSADWAGHGYWIAPGAWDQPSMASWAKARELQPPDARSASLGFRLVRD